MLKIEMTDEEKEALARENFWAEVDKRNVDALKAKEEDDLRPMQMLAIAICAAVTAVVMVVFCALLVHWVFK